MTTYIYKTTKKIKVSDEYKDFVPDFFPHDSKEDLNIGHELQFDFHDDDGELMYRLFGEIYTFISFQEKTGHISGELKNSIDKSVKSLIKKKRELKIGITGRHPKNRFIEYLDKNEGWRDMVILYKTKSSNYIKDLERHLIYRHWDFIQNQIGGGGGRLSEKGIFYLYVVLK
jgi:hypothetical protein